MAQGCNSVHCRLPYKRLLPSCHADTACSLASNLATCLPGQQRAQVPHEVRMGNCTGLLPGFVVARPVHVLATGAPLENLSREQKLLLLHRLRAKLASLVAALTAKEAGAPVTKASALMQTVLSLSPCALARGHLEAQA